MTEPKAYLGTLNAAIAAATEAEYENGMATYPFAVEREDCYLKVIRKCGTTELPDHLLFKVVPKNGWELWGPASPDYSEIESHITEAVGLSGDVSVSLKHEPQRVTAIVPLYLVR